MTDEHLEGSGGRDRHTRLVIVDDHPSYAQGLGALFEALDEIQVVATPVDLQEAVTEVQTHQPDMVLMDLRLPERSGIEGIRKLRALYPELKIVALTASNEASDLQEAMRAGADGYLLKASDAGQLISGIRAVLAGKTVVASELAGRLFDPPGVAPTTVSDQELHILKLLSDGLDQSRIAKEISVSESTLKRQLSQIERKLGARSRIEAVAIAARRGLI